MIWFPDAQQINFVTDISNQNKPFVVVAYSDDKPSFNKYVEKYLGRGCQIYKEHGENLYTLVCPIEVVKSDENNMVKAAE